MASYKWVTLYKEFPKTEAIYGIKISTGSRPNADMCCYMSELAGYDATSQSWNGGTTAAKGYYTYHRLNPRNESNVDFFDSWNHTSDGGNLWSTLEVIDGWKYHEYPQAIYWAGELTPGNWNAERYALIQFMVKVPFSPSKSSFTFDSTGGTQSFTIESESSWSCSNPTWATITPSSGEGDSTVTITVGEYTGTDDRREVITFTNSDGDTFDISIRQRKPSTGGYSGFYKGDYNIMDMYLGENAIEYIYLGENIIFQRGEFAGLRVSPKSIEFDKSGSTSNISIRSSEAWTVTSYPDWITLSQSSGIAGKFTITATASDLGSGDDRFGTIDVETVNYSASVDIQQLAWSWDGYVNITLDCTSATEYNCTTDNRFQKSSVAGYYIDDDNSTLYTDFGYNTQHNFGTVGTHVLHYVLSNPTTIGQSSFVLPRLKGIEIPYGVTTIGKDAFGSSISEQFEIVFDIPETVTTLGGDITNGGFNCSIIKIRSHLSVQASTFCWNQNLKKIYSYTTTPPFTNPGTAGWQYGYPRDVELHIPVGCIANYAGSWQNWANSYNWTIIEDL